MLNSTKSDDLFHQAMKAWETAAEAGVKMQEESANGYGKCFASRLPSLIGIKKDRRR